MLQIFNGIRKVADGVLHTLLRGGITGELIIGQAHGKYYEPASRKTIFYAANQAATTWSVALNTTHTGLVLSNPPGSGVNIAILQVGFALSVAPAGIAHIGLFGGFLSTGITVHTTPLTPACSFLGTPKGQGLADGAATLVGTPVWLMPIQGGFTAGALPGSGMNMIDVEGSIIIPPGGYAGIGALTAAIGFGAIIYEEIPI